MKNKTILLLLISLIFYSNTYSDTITCCESDTLTLWYYYQGVLHNDECDIKMDDTLFVGSAETVYVELEIASTIPNFIMQHKENDLCEFNTIDMGNNIFAITDGGKFSGEMDNGTAGPPITNFFVVKGDSQEITDPYILPQSFESPSYEIKLGRDFESYQWSTGAETNTLLVNQPGNYSVQATNYCDEIFENAFLFNEADFYNDQFYAGKTVGDNIDFVDFIPDSISHIVDGGENSFDFDINIDGLTDITVDVSYVSAMSNSGSWLTVSPQNGCKIAVDGNEKIAARIEPGQIINKYNSFSSAPTINLVMSYSSMLGSCFSGQYWNTNNYIGFSIPTPIDTLYGWMEIEYSLSKGSSDLTIDGYAFITDYPVKINKNQHDLFSVYPNPFSDNLKINCQLQNYSISLVDVFGKAVIRQEKKSGNNNISIQSLPPGIYFLVIESETLRQTQKVVKQY